MKRTEGNNEEYEKGRQGIANLVMLEGNLVRIDFEAGGVSVNLKKDDLPEYCPFLAGQSPKVVITLNKKEDKVLFVSPAQGEFSAKFSKFSGKEGEAPVATSRPGKKGKPYMAFNSIIELIGNKRWDGATYAAMMYPNFGADEDGNLTVAGSGSGSDMLDDFLTSIGIKDGDIKASENPLPDIQRVAQNLGKTFRVIISRGYIDVFIPDAQEDEWEDTVSNTVADDGHPLLLDTPEEEEKEIPY